MYSSHVVDSKSVCYILPVLFFHSITLWPFRYHAPRIRGGRLWSNLPGDGRTALAGTVAPRMVSKQWCPTPRQPSYEPGASRMKLTRHLVQRIVSIITTRCVEANLRSRFDPQQVPSHLPSRLPLRVHTAARWIEVLDAYCSELVVEGGIWYANLIDVLFGAGLFFLVQVLLFGVSCVVWCGCGDWARSELCPDRTSGQGNLFPLDLGLSFQPPIYPNPLLLIAQLPNNHPKSIRSQLQPLISSWSPGDIISESIEVSSQTGSRDVLGDRYSGQHSGVLVFWVCDGAFEMVDAV
jgi:hypothetical protein